MSVFALRFNFLDLFAPDATLITLPFVFGFYAILNRVFNLCAMLNLRNYDCCLMFLIACSNLVVYLISSVISTKCLMGIVHWMNVKPSRL